jgi:hypothetical protein
MWMVMWVVLGLHAGDSQLAVHLQVRGLIVGW